MSFPGMDLRQLEAPTDARECRYGILGVVRWAAWFGLSAGLLELIAFVVKCKYFDPRNANVSRQYPWMFPIAGVMVLLGPGLALALVLAARPGLKQIAPVWVLGILSFFAYAGILFRLPIYTAAALLLAVALAIRTGRFLSGRLDAFDRLVVRSLWVLIALLSLTAAIRHGREVVAERRAMANLPEGSPGARNVILIVLDTVRAESLGLYGYRRNTTPNLERLAARGVRFDRAYSTAPWTAPSHASMFTGRWPHELTIGWNRPLDRTTPTLAEALGARGYTTAGFVANTTYCSYETGLDRGFAHYEDYDVSPRAILLCSALVQRSLNFVHKHPGLARLLGEASPASGHRKSAERINADFRAWMRRQPDRPFFAFLNYFDAHHPYLSPEHDEGASFGRTPESPADLALLRSWWETDKQGLDGREVELARDSYDRCIASLDRQIGKLHDELERAGLLRKTLIVVTADHGEHLGERRLFGHGCSVYLPELHVPLLVIAPGLVPEGKVVAEPVSLRDLPATIVDQLGIAPGDRASFPGCSLARTWLAGQNHAASAAEPLLSEIDTPAEADPNQGRSPVCRGPLLSLVDRNLHYIRNGDGREEVYDIEDDPHETHDLARSPAAEITDALRRFRMSVPLARQPRPRDPDRVGGSGGGFSGR